MTSAFLNALEAIFPAVPTILYVALIGFGVQAAVAGYVRFPRSLGITAGIGLSLTTLLRTVTITGDLLFVTGSRPPK